MSIEKIITSHTDIPEEEVIDILGIINNEFVVEFGECIECPYLNNNYTRCAKHNFGLTRDQAGGCVAFLDDDSKKYYTVCGDVLTPLDIISMMESESLNYKIEK